MREHELERSALPVAGSLHVRVSAEVRGGVAEQRRLRVEQKRGPPRGDGGVRGGPLERRPSRREPCTFTQPQLSAPPQLVRFTPFSTNEQRVFPLDQA